MSGQFLSANGPKGDGNLEKPPIASKAAMDRNTIINSLIEESQASYPGNCLCPEKAVATRLFASDVLEQMIRDYIAQR